ncbi:hypothetical protein [Cupriavidus sp. CP313]
MELKEIEHASISTSGWAVVQASRLEALRKLAAAAQTVVQDWPQVLTDEEMNGGDAVDWIGRLYRMVCEIQGISVEPVDQDAVAEWVGLHYGKNYDAETGAAKAEWIRRYQESHQEAAALATSSAPPGAPSKANPLCLHLYRFLFPVASWTRTGQDITPEQMRDGIQKRLDAAYSEGTLLEMIGKPEQTAEVCA